MEGHMDLGGQSELGEDMRLERHTDPGHLHVWPISTVNLHYRSQFTSRFRSHRLSHEAEQKAAGVGLIKLMKLISVVPSLGWPLLLLAQ